MDEQTIAALVKKIGEDRMPDWWVHYASQLSYNLQVHTKGLLFDKVTGLYPNEHPDSQKHCINSYESITKGSIWKAINNIIRVFNNSSYNIQISDRTRAVIEEYQDSEGSLFSQFLEDWIKYAVATDPNGLCVWYPLDYTDDLYRYVCYRDLVSVSDDTLIFVSEYESEKKYEFVNEKVGREIFIDYGYGVEGGLPNVNHTSIRTFNRQLETRYTNKVYHVFTLTHFIRFYKDDPGDPVFKYEFWAHPKELETLPYFENGGVEVEAGLYESFVQAFVPFGNLALMAHRNQRATDLMFSYPRMSEVQQPCDECSSKGQVPCATSDTGWETCKTCKGSKYLAIQSPYKVYKKIHDSFDVDGKVFSTPSVEFYTPPTAVMDYNNKQWQNYLGQAEEAVYVQRKVDTGNVESFEKKRLDQEGMYTWLDNIAKVLYNNLQMGLQYLENYVNPSPMTVSVERPYSYAILTESEAFEALALMLNSPSPAPVKDNQIDNFVNKFISDSSPIKRVIHILKKYDPLLYFTDETLSNYRGLNSVSTSDLIKHIYAYPLLKQMYELDNGLFELEDDAIIARLSKLVEVKDTTRDLRTSILTAVPTNGTPITTNAE